ncbi:MAG: hypothetical protein WC667_05040 [Sulfurimonas sp.]|jgi:thioredoxin-related protein
MKKLFLTILLVGNLFASTPILNLNGIFFYDAKEVLNYSNSEDTRKIILLFSSQRCSHCITFKNQLASLDIKTKQYLGTKYIFALVEDDIQMLQMFKVTSTPTTFVMTQNKKFVIAPMVGEPKNINEFVDYLIKSAEI